MIIKNHNKCLRNQDTAIQKKILGSLERDVMEFMWQSGEATVSLISKAIANKRPQSLASLGTVMKRLANKGLLIRINDENGLRYCVTFDARTIVT